MKVARSREKSVIGRLVCVEAKPQRVGARFGEKAAIGRYVLVGATS